MIKSFYTWRRQEGAQCLILGQDDVVERRVPELVVPVAVHGDEHVPRQHA